MDYANQYDSAPFPPQTNPQNQQYPGVRNPPPYPPPVQPINNGMFNPYMMPMPPFIPKQTGYQ